MKKGGIVWRAFSGSFALQIGAVIGSFAASWYIARQLGAEQYGVYANTFQWVTILSGIVSAIYDKLLIRRIAIYQNKQEYSLQKGLLILTSAIALVGGVTVWCLCRQIAYAQSWTDTAILCAQIAIPLTILTAFCQSYLTGMGKTIAARVPDLIVRPFTLCILLLIAGFTYFFTNNSSEGQTLLDISTLKLFIPFQHILATNTAMYLNTMAMGFAFLVALLWVARPLAKAITRTVATYNHTDWIAQMRWLSLLGIVSLINGRADILLLGWLAPNNIADVGIYHIALRLADLLKMPLIAMNIVISPQIAILHAQNKQETLQILLKQQVRIALLVSLLIAAGLIGLGIPLLSWWGKDFEAAYIPLCFLCVAQLFNVFCGPVSNILNMTGYTKEAFIALLITSCVNITLQCIFIPLWGANGAAIAAAISVITWNIITVYLCKKKAGINVTVL